MYRFNSRLPSALLGSLLAGSLLAGCSETASYYDMGDSYLTRRMTVSAGAGDAVYGNRVVQAYDPWPVTSANQQLSSNGPVIAGAIERYRTGRVIAPRGVGTSSSGYGAQAAQPATPAASPGAPNP
jgi:hypothetical protein